MIIVLSPAKTLDFESESLTKEHSKPLFLKESERLIKTLQKKSKNQLKSLMNISDDLAELNIQRYQDWTSEMEMPEAKQSVLAFQGDVYQGLQADNFTSKDFDFAQKHLRILSGLHGILKPLDLIHPYRLEMGTKLKVGTKKHLYEFWDGKVTEVLNNEFSDENDKYLVNLASNEYFKVIQKKKLDAEIITPTFKEFKNGQYKVISFFAKKARGMMTAFAIKNKITNPEHLKAFDEDGYIYNEELSKGNDWVFTRG